MSAESAALIAAAKRLGKWVHVGRVNTRTRMAWCQRHGVDSFDGTGQTIAPDTNIPLAQRWLREIAAELAGRAA